VRIIVDSVGRYVGVAYTGTVLQPGEQVIDLSQADVDKLLEGSRWESSQSVLDGNRAWRDSPRATQVLALPNDASGNAALDGTNLLRNIVQDLVKETQQHARQLNTLFRSVQFDTNPGIVTPGDDDSGPGV